MDSTVVMPRLGSEMEKGTIIEWVKKQGEKVSKGDVLFIVDTEKAEVEVEAEVAGVLKEIIVSDDTQEVPVGDPVAVIETED